MRQFHHFYLANNLHLYAFMMLIIHLTLFVSVWYGIFLILALVRIPVRYFLLSLVVVVMVHLFERDSQIPDTCTVIRVDKYAICKGDAVVQLSDMYQVGDVVKLVGQPKEISSASTLFSFDYAKYLKSKGIDYVWEDDESFVIDSVRSIYDLREYAKEYMERYPLRIRTYMHALLLGDRTYFEDALLEKINVLGISHLFAISGLHVGFFVLLLQKILPDNRLKSIVLYCFLFLFIFIAGNSVSVMRASMLFVGLQVLKRYGFTALDVLSMIFLFLYIQNPFVLYDVAFQLSFGVTLALLLTHSSIKGGIYRQLLVVSFIAAVATGPIVIALNNSIQPVSVFLNVLFVWLVSTFLLPLTVILLVIPELSTIAEPFVAFFEHLIVFIDIETFRIDFATMHPVMLSLYYMSFLFQKTSKMWLVILLLQMVIGPEFWNSDVIVFDVDQGNAVFVQNKTQDCSMLMDTGKEYATKQVVYDYFKGIGLQSLDYLLVTHGDSDHSGGVEFLLKNMDVSVLVVSKISSDPKIHELKEVAERHRVTVLEVAKGDIVCGMEVLDPVKQSSNNNESIVLRYKQGYSMLFLADTELKKSYGNIDVMMLGHHGSSTSLNTEMMGMNPRITLLSVGRNGYGLPNYEVLELVRNTELFRTDEMDSIYYLYDRREFYSNAEFRRLIYRPLWYTN